MSEIHNVPDPAGKRPRPPVGETDPRKAPLGTPAQEVQTLLRHLLGVRNAVRLALIQSGRALAVCGGAVGPPDPDESEEYVEEPPWTVEEFSTYLPTIVSLLGMADDKIAQVLTDTVDLPPLIKSGEFK